MLRGGLEKRATRGRTGSLLMPASISTHLTSSSPKAARYSGPLLASQATPDPASRSTFLQRLCRRASKAVRREGQLVPQFRAPEKVNPFCAVAAFNSLITVTNVRADCTLCLSVAKATGFCSVAFCLVNPIAGTPVMFVDGRFHLTTQRCCRVVRRGIFYRLLRHIDGNGSIMPAYIPDPLRRD